MNQIEMIVMDIDGTLLNSQHEISTMTKEVLIDLQKQGKSIVLASGRDIPSLKEIGKNLDMSHYPQSGYICLNGLEIYNAKEQCLHSEEKLSMDDAYVLSDLAKDYKLDMILFFDDSIYIIEYAKTGIMEFHFLNSQRHLIKDIRDIPQELFSNLKKIAYLQYGKDMIEILKRISKDERNVYELCMVEADWVEVNPMGMNKGNALTKLAKMKDISLDQVICFGNGENDISMIQTAGMGIAMGNAFDNVKNEADDVCLDNDHDGIGKYLEDKMIMKTKV